MTEPLSSQTDSACLGLCSSHNLSANYKNIPIICNDDITRAIDPDPTSALPQNSYFLLDTIEDSNPAQTEPCQQSLVDFPTFPAFPQQFIFQVRQVTLSNLDLFDKM